MPCMHGMILRKAGEGVLYCAARELVMSMHVSLLVFSWAAAWHAPCMSCRARQQGGGAKAPLDKWCVVCGLRCVVCGVRY